MKTKILLPYFSHKFCICYATDNNYAKYLSVSLLSLRKNASKNFNYEIVVLGNNLSKENVNKLSSIFVNVDNIKIRFYAAEQYLDNQNLYIFVNLSKTAYLRFAIFDILSKYKKVLYLDCDTLILNDPSKIFDIDLENKCIAAALDFNIFHAAFYETNVNNFDKLLKNELENVIKIRDKKLYFNSGVMLFDIKNNLDCGITTKKLFEIANKRKWCIVDQSVLNFVYQNYDYHKIILLDYKWNSCAINLDFLDDVPLEIKNYITKSQPNIIHYAGNTFDYTYILYSLYSPYHDLLISSLLKLRINQGRFENSFIKKTIVKIIASKTIIGKILRYCYIKKKKAKFKL